MNAVVWRDSARPLRLGPFDVRLVLLAFAWMFVPTLETTGILVAVFVGFRVAEARGYRLRPAVRRLRAATCGRRRALYHDGYRRFADLYWL